ncbi:trypsin-like peptidase domain-containing protein [Coprococcus hominis (ex Arizal et al. 2022)]|jgi:serine protease Do|nr:trypsin-like peptidase domain-containing protein [Coprococcus hominis (ex Arizal et al. 2022)]
MSNGGIDMMDEFENNRENEHVDQTPHAETPYDTGDGNTDNLKRTEQQTEQNAEHRQEDAYTQAQQYGSTYYGDMRTQEYMQAMAERAQQMSQGTEHYYNNNYQQPNQNAYNYGQNNYYQNGFQNADAEQPKAKVKKAKKQRVKKAKSPKTPHNKRTFWKKGVAVVASAAVFGGVAGGAFYGIAGNQIKKLDALTNTTTEVASTTSAATTQSLSLTSTASVGNGMDVSTIAENVMPSVVAINISAIVEQQGMFGYTQQYEAEGSGSGIIIGENDSELLMVTNNHVVSDATTVNVTFADGESYEAQVKSTDSDTDLAIVVVKLSDIKESTMNQIKIATIGDSDSLKVGEQVVAIGNALGYGQSVTTGIVSAKDRTNSTNTTPLIQTDAAINPGNSGGALLNMKGEVIGINSSKYSDTTVEGMGYAIPITAVQDRLDDLMNRQTREKVDESEKGYLGISCATVSSDVSEAYGIPEGVLVTDVASKSAAEKAGIKANYVITKIDGQSISSAEELTEKLNYYAVGETVPITYEYLKDDAYVEKTVDVTLMENPNANNK